MRFQISARLGYTLQPPATLLFNVRVRPSASQQLIEESLTVQPPAETEQIVTKPEENRFDRLQTYDLTELILEYRATVETSYESVMVDQLSKETPAHMDHTWIPYLMPSRYCQSDALGRLALQKFGHIHSPYDQVTAITEWINTTVEYLPGATNSSTSAYDTVTQCAGVCRDFAHLGIALCRALTIPARYFTGYAYQLQPPDFHACFEALIGGKWLLFDATHLAPLNGLVRIGYGRDAADVSVCTTFGYVQLNFSEVSCQSDGQAFEPLTQEKLRTTAIALN